MDEEFNFSNFNILRNIPSKYWKSVWNEVHDRIIQKFNYGSNIIVIERKRKGDTQTQMIIEYNKRRVVLDISLETFAFEYESKKNFFGSKLDVFFNGTLILNSRREIYNNFPTKGTINRFPLRFKLNSKGLNLKDLEKNKYQDFLVYASGLISTEILVYLEDIIPNSLKLIFVELDKYKY